MESLSFSLWLSPLLVTYINNKNCVGAVHCCCHSTSAKGYSPARTHDKKSFLRLFTPLSLFHFEYQICVRVWALSRSHFLYALRLVIPELNNPCKWQIRENTPLVATSPAHCGCWHGNLTPRTPLSDFSNWSVTHARWKCSEMLLHLWDCLSISHKILYS